MRLDKKTTTTTTFTTTDNNKNIENDPINIYIKVKNMFQTNSLQNAKSPSYLYNL